MKKERININVNGVINKTGEYDSPSFLYTWDDPDLLQYVEESIKPLVSVLIKHGYKPKSSCQGHTFINPKTNEQDNYLAHVVVESENQKNEILFLSIIKRYKRVNNLDENIVTIRFFKSFNEYMTPHFSIVFNIDFPDENRSKINHLIFNFSSFLDEYFVLKKDT